MNANLHDNRHTPDTLVVIDTYDWYENDRKESEQTDVFNEAMLLTGVASTHGRRVEYETITNEKDKARANSYQRMEHNIHSMNGNRPTELIQVITDLIARVNHEKPEKVIVVGDHEAYQLLCSVAEQNGAEVQIWTSNPKLPAKLRSYDTRLLNTLLPTLRKTKRSVVVRLDVENHLITLHKRGCSPDAHAYLEAIRKTIGDLGNIINIQAWADWERLRQSLGRDYQRDFEQNGVKTFYQINEPGKSTSDMAMGGSIHESLDRDNDLDIYVIGTGDADFTPVVDSIHNRGRKAVVLTLQGSLSRKLEKAADEVRFLDAHFSLKTPTSSPIPQRGVTNKGLAATLVVSRTLRTRHWQYIFVDRLPNWLPADWIQEAVGTGLLIHRSPSENNGLVLNMEHPVTRQAAFFEKWVQRHLHYYLHIRKFDWVDTSFITRGMQMDKGCQELGIGQDRNSAIAMLEASREAHQLVKKTIPHPKHLTTQINTWILPDDDPETKQAQPNSLTETDQTNPIQPQEMVEPTDIQSVIAQEVFQVMVPLSEKIQVTAF